MVLWAAWDLWLQYLKWPLGDTVSPDVLIFISQTHNLPATKQQCQPQPPRCLERQVTHFSFLPESWKRLPTLAKKSCRSLRAAAKAAEQQGKPVSHFHKPPVDNPPLQQFWKALQVQRETKKKESDQLNSLIRPFPSRTNQSKLSFWGRLSGPLCHVKNRQCSNHLKVSGYSLTRATVAGFPYCF